MAKTYTVDLPITQTRELKYTRQERLDFERRLRDRGLAGMKEILDKLVLPTRDIGGGRREVTLGGDLEAQEYLVFLGLRHIGTQITEKRVSEWLELASREEGRPLIQFVAPAVQAVFASGVLGYVYEPKLEEEEVAPATEGKAPEAGATP